jgi:uncharacterized metal-binding protein YceD (DUF177 family)
MMEPEFSRPVDTARLGSSEALYDIAANDRERAALARRFGLVSLDQLAAKVQLRRIPGGLVRLTASFSAELAQSCVVTLDPVADRIEENFTLLYGEPNDDSMNLEPDAELIEPLDHDHIDLGEAVAQQLSLALDPYPRSPAAIAATAPGEPIESPFAALAKLRQMK